MPKEAFRGRSGLNLDILEQVVLWAEVGWTVPATLGIHLQFLICCLEQFIYQSHLRAIYYYLV